MIEIINIDNERSLGNFSLFKACHCSIEGFKATTEENMDLIRLKNSWTNSNYCLRNFIISMDRNFSFGP